MTRVTGIITGVTLGTVALGVAACGGGSASTTGPSGTVTVQGQLLREPTVRVAAASEGVWRRAWAVLGLGTAWAATTQPVPVPNMTVAAAVNGQPAGTAVTDGGGRFQFRVPAGATVQLHLQDGTGQHLFEHSIRMDQDRVHDQAMATYCVLWGNGTPAGMSCADEPGDHWDYMMRGEPAGRWDEARHGWQMGMR